MFKRLCTYLQYALPQHGLSQLAGKLADSRTPWFKDFLIKNFMHTYQINLQEAVLENPQDYPSFNEFFIRRLKPECRPIASNTDILISPVDGTVAQIGAIQGCQLLQAKNFYFDLQTLLGNDPELTSIFTGGSYSTLYLAPHNYHRVHMPLDGYLRKTIYVPGRLFSVNRITSTLIPNVFSRNERLIALFDTAAGPMAVILIGALIVGSIQTIWQNAPVRAKQVIATPFSEKPFLSKGNELGYFKLGSTVILLFAKDRIAWQPSLHNNTTVLMGTPLGQVLSAV